MGNFLSAKPNSPVDKSLFLQLKRNKLKDLYECMETIEDQYPHTSFLSYQDFDDIFGPLLPDTEPLFTKISDYNKEKENVADLYESLSIFALFNSDEFEYKIGFLFKLFDFDRSNTIESDELVLTFQAVVRALCKLAGLPLPTMAYLEGLANALFSVVDTNKNKHIDFEEFYSWLTKNDEFQSFLLKYSGSQTIFNARKRFRESMIHLEAIISCRMNKNLEVSFGELQQVLLEELKDIDKENLENLWDILISSSNEYRSQTDKITRRKSRNLARQGTFQNVMINKEVYMDVMRAWSAFSSTDVNGYNYLSIHELKILLWLYEDEEPNPFRLSRDMKEIDNNNTETIDRLEWMRYLCVQDDMTGHQIFRANLKKVFNKYDVDKSGTLTIKEIKAMLKDTFKEFIESVDDEMARLNLGMLMESLAVEIMEELNQDNEYNLSWDEFKLFMDKCMEKQEKMEKFLASTA